MKTLGDQLHLRAVEVSTRYRRTEGERVEVLQEIEEHQVFLVRGHSRLFRYAVVELGLSESEMLKLRRVQDLLSQARRRAVSLEETVEALTEEFLLRHDPVERARRHEVRKGSGAPAKDRSQNGKNPKADLIRKLGPVRVRIPIPRVVLHRANLRDQRRCAHVSREGLRWGQARWVEIHHKRPLNEGGTHDLENLITLCSAHHRFWHLEREVESSIPRASPTTYKGRRLDSS